MLNSRTVLFVQSMADSVARLRPRLENAGYTVVEAGDADAAMTILNRSEIGLVVTELYLPVGKDRCLVRAIRRARQLRRTRVLAYTAHGQRKDRTWARRAGAQGYVITRSGEERLLQVVDSLMHKAPRATARAVPDAPAE